MSSHPTTPVSAEERAYYLATAMLSTTFEYGREGDTEVWWSTLLPSLVSRMFLLLTPRLTWLIVLRLLGLTPPSYASSITFA